MKNQQIGGGGLPKKGGLDSLQIYGMALARGGCFRGGRVDTPMHTMGRLKN